MLKEFLDKSAVAQSFSQSAHHYDEAAFLQQEVAMRLLSRLEAICISPRSILDIGSGTGFLSQALQKKYPEAQIISLDSAEGMLRFAQQKMTADFLYADAEDLPLQNNSIDLICSSLLVHWCPDIQKAFSEMQRVLVPNGLLLFSTLGANTLMELRKSWAQVDDYHHVHPFLEIKTLGNGLNQTAFKDVVIDKDDIICQYPDVMQLMRDLKNIGAHNLNPHREKSLTGKGKIKRMMQAYEKFRDEDQEYPATYEVFYAHAWKGEAMQKTQSHEVYIPLEAINR